MCVLGRLRGWVWAYQLAFGWCGGARRPCGGDARHRYAIRGKKSSVQIGRARCAAPHCHAASAGRLDPVSFPDSYTYALLFLLTRPVCVVPRLLVRRESLGSPFVPRWCGDVLRNIPGAARARVVGRAETRQARHASATGES